LITWSDRKTHEYGQNLYRRGCVRDLDLNNELIRATVAVGGAAIRTRFKILTDGSVEADCPCRLSREQGLICVHVLAAGHLVAAITEDSLLERRLRVNLRRADEPDETAPIAGIIRLAEHGENATRATLRMRVDTDWLDQWDAGAIRITIHAVYNDGKRRLDRVSEKTRLCWSDADTQRLYVLEDFANSQTTPGMLELSREELVDLLVEFAPGELYVVDRPEPIPICDTPVLGALTVSLIKTSGDLRLCHRTEGPTSHYLYNRRRAWALGSSGLAPLEHVLQRRFQAAYSADGQIVARTDVIPFLEKDLPKLAQRWLIDADVDRNDLKLCDLEPDFEVECDGDLDAVNVRLLGIYGDSRVPVGRVTRDQPAYFPIPGAPLSYARRDRAAEEEALSRIWFDTKLESSADGVTGICGADAVVRFLSDTVPALRRAGWRVTVQDALETFLSDAEWVRPRINISARTEPGWFDTHISYVDAKGRKVDSDEVEDAVSSRHAILHINGRSMLLNTTLIESLQEASSECTEIVGDHDRISDIHAGYLAAILKDHPEIDVRADAAWKQAARRQTERLDLETVEVGDLLEGIIRPYQREGVNWLRFLERGGYCGILADEMGLGKTLQALAWIQLKRSSVAANKLPSLVLCPSSLLENWAREAARFAPRLSCMIMQGPGRHALWDQIPSHDLVITSYALLRRDAEKYATQPFAIAVLDEAQHIKNRSTQNSRAAKRIQALHRLVLTGTPMENSVADLWSIMDFLMPRYLGTATVFREMYERPIAAGEDSAERALCKLRHKMRPFMLRRLKIDVAQDLPEKVTRVATCSMSEEQATRYRRLARRYQENLSSAVGEQGFNASRFTVLKALLRLRQLCCHPALLKEREEDREASSAKLDLFFELLNEAMDGGHRVLVFSQFVEMLHILRDELAKREIPIAYLDGSTRNRQAEIDRFNTDESVPVFLVSLKAGGTGLNLTGANVVIHYDPWWNPAVEDQATDRVHRIGQTKNVYSIKLITQDTIEEKVLQLQDRKRAMIDATVGGTTDVLKSLGWDEVLELLRL